MPQRNVPAILEQYANLCRQSRELEAQVDLLKPSVLAYCLENQKEDHLVEGGKILLSIRRQWTYPDEVVKLEGTLKEKKKEAEAKGDATYVEKPLVIFKEDKVDTEE